MKIKKARLAISVLIFLLISVNQIALGHEVIFDFSHRIEKGETVDIEFSFGHFPAHFDHEHSFFVAMEKGDLMVVSEDGSVTEIDFSRVNDKYRASFTPPEAGVYWIVFNGSRGVLDRVADGGGMELRYYDAKAPLLVGDSSGITVAKTPLDVEFINGKSTSINEGDQITLELSYLGASISQQDVIVVTPSEQVRELTTDDKGEIKLDFNETGKWLIHIGNLTDRDRMGEAYAEGTQKVVEYDRIRYNSALYLEVEARKGFLERLFSF